MEMLIPLIDRWAALLEPWRSIFAFDFGRYLAAALLVSLILLAGSRRHIALRQVRTRRPASRQIVHEVWHSFGAAIVFSLVGLSVYYGARHGLLHIYSDVARYGWAYWLASLAAIVFAHDAYFYWTHRAMHLPALFVRVHRTHHVSVAPTQWAAYSFSLGEAFGQAAFLPVYLLFVPTHTSVLFIWMAHQVLRNVFGHCGVEFAPRSWLSGWWGRWLTTTLHHDMHHALGRCNYGLYFRWWDRWCGTEHPEYAPRLRELIARIDASASVPAAKEA